MKLIKFNCIVALLRAQDEGESVEDLKAHSIWINPDAVQMVAPRTKEQPDVTIIEFTNDTTTSVEGTMEEVVAALTEA